MSDEEVRARRAHRDAGDLAEHLNRLVGSFVLPHVVTAGIRRRVAEQLVTWGWTRLGFDEEVRLKPVPRNTELSLRDELVASIAGVSGGEVRALTMIAEHLVNDGWVKLAEGEKVVRPMSHEEAFETVRRALEHWERLKKEARDQPLKTNWARYAQQNYAEQRGPEGSEVSADASELTSGVKVTKLQAQILRIFATATEPLGRVGALTVAAGPDAYGDSEVWNAWSHAFFQLQEQGLLELAPDQQPGHERTYVITQAGRGLHELDGVDR